MTVDSEFLKYCLKFLSGFFFSFYIFSQNIIWQQTSKDPTVIFNYIYY